MSLARWLELGTLGEDEAVRAEPFADEEIALAGWFERPTRRSYSFSKYSERRPVLENSVSGVAARSVRRS